MVHWVAKNLEQFADWRGGDTFVTVLVTRDGETAAHEFRSGHYLTLPTSQTPGEVEGD